MDLRRQAACSRIRLGRARPRAKTSGRVMGEGPDARARIPDQQDRERFPEGRRKRADSGPTGSGAENDRVDGAPGGEASGPQSRITLEPMSPRDRRVIHLSLAKFPGVSTRSDGQGAERRVRIIPARQPRADRQPRRD